LRVRLHGGGAAKTLVENERLTPVRPRTALIAASAASGLSA
jgi:hypothetical protein